MAEPLDVLVVGAGSMGASHARGYASLPGYRVAGFVVHENVERARRLAAALALDVPVFTDFRRAIAETRPDVVSINTLPDTHAPFAIHAMQAGCHVFLEKPIARTAREAEQVASTARRTKRKLVVGYILRVHPAWKRFIELARTLGKPLVMRMNLNQQSFAAEWAGHRRLIDTVPPLVDCGVHYVDVMCQMTRAKPVLVQAIGARVADDIPADACNYGALQVVFDDRSVGWYEVGWGPMMSRVAFFVKDVVGPKGSVSIDRDTRSVDPADLSKHTTVDSIILHSSAMDREGRPASEDQVVHIDDEPDHDELCRREQQLLYEAIVRDTDLGSHLDDAVNSLKVCLAGVESYRKGKAIRLLTTGRAAAGPAVR